MNHMKELLREGAVVAGLDLGGRLRSAPRLKLITLIVHQLKTETGRDEHWGLTSAGSSGSTIVFQTLKP